MGITPTSIASYVAQSLLQQIEAKVLQEIGAAGQQDVPAQDSAADTSAPDAADPAAAMANLRALLADPSIVAQLKSILSSDSSPKPASDPASEPASDPASDSPSTPDTTGGGSPASGYTVKSGDTLWDIAKERGISLQSLIAANPQISNPDLIYPGQNINIPGGGAVNGSAPVNPTGSATLSNGSGVAGIAESFLERHASELKGSGELPMNAGVPNDVCCANFVSAVLQKAGLLSPGEHTDGVSALKTTLENKGWKSVNLADAKPGDVVIIGGDEHHTEIVAKNENGKITLVGSNNRNDDGSQRVCYDDYTANHESCLILTPP